MYRTKKNIPFLRGPLFAFVGCCGHVLTCVGRRWLLWAFVGFVLIKKCKIKCRIPQKTYLSLYRLRGPALTFVGCCGPALTCVGRRWLLWAFVGFVVIKKQKIKCTVQKKTYLFFVGLHLPLLAAVGMC